MPNTTKSSDNSKSSTGRSVASKNSSTKTTQVPVSKTEKPPQYTCWSCGKTYDTLHGNFMQTNFPLFKAMGYYPVCKDCTDAFYDEMVKFFDGDTDKAFKLVCLMYGFYFNDSMVESTKKLGAGRTRMRAYISRAFLNPYTELSLLDVISENKAKGRKSDNGSESSEGLYADESPEITKKMVKFWGVGYKPEVYVTLQGYYDELLKLCDTKPDVKKQKMMKNLCLLEYQMQVNIQAGKDIGALSNSYKAVFEAADLTSNNSTDVSEDSYGKWLQEIEKYSPAEYYKDKNKYHDFFGIVDYIERFCYRPLKNLILGTKEKDSEYWINDEDVDGGES